ncbi:MAG: hypothetical protein HC918_00330 [Oscillatoriales cyanobacterium SM2_1_8]|nr:hypothetical protein [Oscillatoriales cyanobacterium SM2_1_8]
MDSSYLSDNFNLVITSLEPSFTWQVADRQKLSLKTGFTTLSGQSFFQPVTLYPLRLGWEGVVGPATVQAGITGYTYDRLRPDVGADARITLPLAPGLVVGGSIERTPMKYAPSTLETPHLTNYTVFGPSLFWQVTPTTRLTSFLSFLNVNDGNAGSISFSKVLQQLGQFSLGATLVTTSYARDSAPNYFTPQDFLIYTGELGWQGDVAPGWNLRLQFNLGEQRIRGEWSNAYYYEAQITAQLAKNIRAFVNYSFGEFQQVTYFRQLTGTNQLYGRSQVLAQVQFTY